MSVFHLCYLCFNPLFFMTPLIMAPWIFLLLMHSAVQPASSSRLSLFNTKRPKGYKMIITGYSTEFWYPALLYEVVSDLSLWVIVGHFQRPSFDLPYRGSWRTNMRIIPTLQCITSSTLEDPRVDEEGRDSTSHRVQWSSKCWWCQFASVGFRS